MSECVETEARHFAVPAPSKAAFSERACLQALSLINFYSGLEALTQVHTRGGMFQAVCLRLLPKTCPPPARGGRALKKKKAAFYLLRLSW